MMKLARIQDALCARVAALTFAEPVTHVYNPLVYARPSTLAYLERYARGRKEVVFVGMNPGPFGMAQTGIPFGDVTMVREFLGIEAKVGKPTVEHPKRPIEGFHCRRSEVSGTRLWGWARSRFETADRFFARFFVWNYCPLVFMESTGRNRTPDKLPRSEREPLFEACDEALRSLIVTLEPQMVIGVGGFAERRARDVLGDRVPVGCILHPSPASPKANRGWDEAVDRELEALGVKTT